MMWSSVTINCIPLIIWATYALLTLSHFHSLFASSKQSSGGSESRHVSQLQWSLQEQTPNLALYAALASHSSFDARGIADTSRI